VELIRPRSASPVAIASSGVRSAESGQRGRAGAGDRKPCAGAGIRRTSGGQPDTGRCAGVPFDLVPVETLAFTSRVATTSPCEKSQAGGSHAIGCRAGCHFHAFVDMGKDAFAIGQRCVAVARRLARLARWRWFQRDRCRGFQISWFHGNGFGKGGTDLFILRSDRAIPARSLACAKWSVLCSRFPARCATLSRAGG